MFEGCREIKHVEMPPRRSLTCSFLLSATLQNSSSRRFEWLHEKRHIQQIFKQETDQSNTNDLFVEKPSHESEDQTAADLITVCTSRTRVGAACASFPMGTSFSSEGFSEGFR